MITALYAADSYGDTATVGHHQHIARFTFLAMLITDRLAGFLDITVRAVEVQIFRVQLVSL